MKNVIALIALVLLTSMLLCAFVLPVFAEGEEETKEPSAFEKWWDSYNEVIGYIVAGLIFVGAGLGIFFWIPKGNDKKKKKRK